MEFSFQVLSCLLFTGPPTSFTGPPTSSSSLAPCVRGLERFDTDKPLTSLSSESSSSADGLPPHQAYIQPGKMKIGNMTSVPAINTIQHSSFGSPQHSSPIKFGGAASRTGSLHSSSGGHSDSFSFPRGLMVYPVMTEEEVVTGNGYYGSEGDSERESISPPRINHHDEVGAVDLKALFTYIVTHSSCVIVIRSKLKIEGFFLNIVPRSFIT